MKNKITKALEFKGQYLKVLDQRYLPNKIKYKKLKEPIQFAYAIKCMIVRGAPLIGITAAYGFALAIKNGYKVKDTYDLLLSTRPTAYDLKCGLDYINSVTSDFIDRAKRYENKVTCACRDIGLKGVELIKKYDTVMTHCNAGFLATGQYGTALAPIYIGKSKIKRVIVSETRPRNQGYLTAWELNQYEIPNIVVADSACGMLMKETNLVIVGADRIAKNGDVANKIGTYMKAVLAKEHDVPFYVAAPFSTIDLNCETGEDIKIEYRDANELTKKFNALNPAFDVTPAKYIKGIITENGIISPEKVREL